MLPRKLPVCVVEQGQRHVVDYRLRLGNTSQKNNGFCYGPPKREIVLLRPVEYDVRLTLAHELVHAVEYELIADGDDEAMAESISQTMVANWPLLAEIDRILRFRSR